MILEVGACKVYYPRDGVQWLIMTFGICNMRVSDQEDNMVVRQVDRV